MARLFISYNCKDRTTLSPSGNGSSTKPVAGLEVTATHLRAGYGDGKVREWELGKPEAAPGFSEDAVPPFEESSGVELDGTKGSLIVAADRARLPSRGSGIGWCEA